MATISFDLSIPALTEVQNAICTLYGYQDWVSGPVNVTEDGRPVFGQVPNTETRAQFTRRIVTSWLKDQVKEYRRLEAAKKADLSDPDIR